VETYCWLALPEAGCWGTAQGCVCRLCGDLNNGLAAQFQRCKCALEVSWTWDALYKSTSLPWFYLLEWWVTKSQQKKRIITARQPWWSSAIIFCCRCLGLFLAPNLQVCLVITTKLSHMFGGDLEFYNSVRNKGPFSKKKFGSQKTSKFQRDFRLHDLIANISRMQQDVVKWKTALQTAITLVHDNPISWLQTTKIGPEIQPTQPQWTAVDAAIWRISTKRAANDAQRCHVF